MGFKEHWNFVIARRTRRGNLEFYNSYQKDLLLIVSYRRRLSTSVALNLSDLVFRV